ncbi:spermine oxidase-like [Episyrphus balteatus]|uniref:spermine oxidase-like n=1 Tax=Episyrphus balteatus TaxID=286459 RepID=UPI0024862086|nr:spermine oxidase-like [Episyrphus balteatus]
MNSAKIIVIGSGPSGIAAATKLLELGFQKVTLLEAENRIGGRINTIPFANNVVDMGAQWCHGEKDNVVFDLANQQPNLLEHSDEYASKQNFIRSNKYILPEATSKRLQDIIDKHIDNEVEMKNFKGSLKEYITEKYFQELQKPENSDIDTNIGKEFFDNFQKFENAIDAADSLSDISTRDYHENWESEGDQLLNWKDKGYLRFLQLLMKSTDSKKLGVLDQRVELGKPVKKIIWSDRGVLVTCEDGEVKEADHVIVTVSLGVLKELHSSLFEPKLPEKKTQAIETLGFGTVNKVFLEFPNEFWPVNWEGFALLWREEDLKEIRGTNRAWLEDMFTFVTVKYQPKLLNGVIVGPNARLMETLPREEVISGCMYLLRKFLKWEIPEPINSTTSSWYSNKHFRGSYSHATVKAEKINAKPAHLASTLVNSENKPVVLFAGEATNDHHFSTVHGAVETGWREAQRLADIYSVK